ncbi:MAG: lipid II:glycine glycyltransferase FemX [Candidatus Dormibacteria bacterium]
MPASELQAPSQADGWEPRVHAVGEAQRAEWDRFVSEQVHGNLLQSYGWGELRRRQSWSVLRLAALDPNEARWVGAIQVLRQPLPLFRRWSWGYAPQGPVLASVAEVEGCRALLRSAGRWLRRSGAIQLKCDPEWPVGAAAEHLRRACGLRPARFDVQQRDTWLVDLAPDSPTTLAGLPSSTRRNIRLAQRAGVEVVRTTEPEAVATFYALHLQTVERQHFTTRPQAYYRGVLEELGASVFVAQLRGEPLAAAIAVTFGPRLIYLFGGTSAAAPEARASYALHWAMIEWGIEADCALYDMWGIPRRFDSSRPDHGYALFKTRWGGRAAHYGGLLIAPLLGPLDPLVHGLEAVALRRRPLLR